MISIECFKGIPSEYESFLLEKYNSFITTSKYIEIYYSTYDIHYALVKRNNELVDLLIFGNRGNTATCFNSLANIDQDVIIEFTNRIFDIYPFIKKINIVFSYNEYSFKKAILYSKTDDNITTLPLTIDEYYSELGYHTRKNIKNRKVRLLRYNPDANFVTKFGSEIDKSVIDKIIHLNWDRMKHKGIVPGIDNTYKNNIYKYSQYYGCVSYLEIGGVIVAGCICTILNKGIFLHVIAYDNNFFKYNVGELCVFNLLETSIQNNITSVHFLWGENELKKRLLAKPHLLFSYFIMRDYSIDYILCLVNIVFFNFLIRIKKSEFSKPIKNAIKLYRKRKWKR